MEQNNTKFILIGLIVVLLMIIGGIYTFSNNSDAEKYSLESEENETTLRATSSVWESILDNYLSEYLSIFNSSSASDYVKIISEDEIDGETYIDREYGRDYYFIDPLTNDRIFPEDTAYIKYSRDLTQIAVSFELIDLTNNDAPELLITWRCKNYSRVLTEETYDIITLHIFNNDRYEDTGIKWTAEDELFTTDNGKILIYNYEQNSEFKGVDELDIRLNARNYTIDRNSILNVVRSNNELKILNATNQESTTYVSPSSNIREYVQELVPELLNITVSNINRLESITNQAQSRIRNNLRQENLIN